MSWLKIEVSTPFKPEMDAIARECKCSRADAFLAFFKFYSWADATTEDGDIMHLTPEGADERAGLSGFGNALGEAGWMHFHSRGATITHFDRHNGQSAKRRATEAERKRRERASANRPH